MNNKKIFPLIEKFEIESIYNEIYESNEGKYLNSESLIGRYKVESIQELLSLTDDLYNEVPRKASFNKKNVQEYIIGEEDTLYGICINFNISPSIIKELNSLSNDILFPGQKILIPIENNNKSYNENNDEKEELKYIPLEDIDFSLIINREKKDNSKYKEIWNNLEELKLEKIKENEIFENMNIRKKLIDYLVKEITINDQLIESFFKYPIYYCTSSGEIRGLLKISKNYLSFEPFNPQIGNDNSGVKKFSQHQILIDISDICEAFMINLPNKYCEIADEYHTQFNKDYYIEINLFRIGDQDIEKNYESRLEVMKKENLPFATIFFKIYDKNYGEEIKNLDKSKIAYEIQKKISEKLINKEQPHEKINTKIPFFDILFENISQNKKLKKQQIIKNLNLHGVLPLSNLEKSKLIEEEEIPGYIPKLNDESMILNENLFMQIWNFLPSVLKLRHWKLIYSNAIHGTSLLTLFNNCGDVGPNIVLIKDFNNCTFGAYCTDSWEKGFKFYGRGESFLFTFKNNNKIICYNWSEKNSYFQFSDSEGLAIGAGDKYGLFIHGELGKGSSYECETFDNDVLSTSNDFLIRFIEIWGCDEFVDF